MAHSVGNNQKERKLEASVWCSRADIVHDGSLTGSRRPPVGKAWIFRFEFHFSYSKSYLGPIFSLLAMLYLSRFFWDYSLSRRWLSACIALTLLVAIDFAIAWYAEYPASFERRMQTTVMHIPQVIAFGLVVPRLGVQDGSRHRLEPTLAA